MTEQQEKIAEALLPKFNQFLKVKNEPDFATNLENILETGARIIRAPEQYGLAQYDKNDIAIVFDRMYRQFLAKQ